MSARERLLAALTASPEVRPGEAEQKVAGLFNEAADVLETWRGDQTPEEERPGYDGPTINAADRLDDCLSPMPREDRARLIADHRQMVVGEVAAELRRMATTGQAPAPQPDTAPGADGLRERIAEHLNEAWPHLMCDGFQYEVADAVLELTTGHAPTPQAETAPEENAVPARALPQIAVACPACGAEPGAPCTSHGGTRTRRYDTHQARRAAWEAKDGDAR